MYFFAVEKCESNRNLSFALYILQDVRVVRILYDGLLILSDVIPVDLGHRDRMSYVYGSEMCGVI